jgi:hypothetical protein
MLRIKDARMVQRILTSDLKAQPGQLHKLQCLLLGMFVGDRLEMPSSMVADCLSFESTVRQQWLMLQNSTARSFMDDVNSLVPHDMTESNRIAQIFWTMRYHAAAPKTLMSIVGVKSFAERYLAMNQLFSQAEIDFMDANRDNLATAYNMLTECVVMESAQ